MKQSLFNISVNYNELINEIEANEGILTDEQSAELEITELQLQSKSIAYLEVIKGKESINTQIDEEIKRLQAMKKVNTNITSRLKENLLNAVIMFGGFEVGLTKFGTRKSQSISVDDINGLPSEFKTIKVTESADKKALKEAIKSGEVISGVELVDNLNLKIN
tara:strand:+ start:27 stop:515 length:489 start_codon:yes stop_codon:yes gene_type:complete